MPSSVDCKNARYQMVLLPCEATSKSYWGNVEHSADSLIALWGICGWGPSCTNHDQKWELRDTKKNRVIPYDEWVSIINKLKGWDKDAP